MNRTPDALEIFAGAALLCLALVAYVPAMADGWVWDDDTHVTQNESLRTANGLRRIWVLPGATPEYSPLTFTSLWIEYHYWGSNPTGYHLINVLLHGVNAWLVWRLLLRLNVPCAWLAAAVFAVHPVHVESVAWVAERKNVLSGLFYLSALLAFVRYTATPTHDWYVLTLAAFLAALLSNVVTCTLPVVLVLLLWWQNGQVTRRDWLALAPMFAAAIGMGLLAVWMERSPIATGDEIGSLSVLQHFLIAARALWFYAGKLLWPAPLIFIYPRWQVDASAAWWYAFPLAGLAVLAGLWLGRGRLGKGPLVAVFAFIVTVFPALGFFSVFPFRHSFVADHFQYLASVPLIALFAVLAFKILGSGVIARSVSAIVVLVLMVLTWQQAFVYLSAQTLWEDTLAKNPDCSAAHANLGLLLAQREVYVPAADHFAEVVRLNPDSVRDRLKFASLSALAGRPDEADHAFRAVLAQQPDSAEAHAGLAGILHRQGKKDEAIRHFKEAVRLDPNNAELHNSLGVVLAEQEKWDAAIEHFATALRLAPTSTLFRRNLDAARQAQKNSPRP